jgi:release factor family 10
MLDLKLLEALPSVPAPVLTVYLNTAPGDLRNLRNPARYLIWLKTQAKALEEGMQKAELRTFRELLQRVEEFLAQSPPQTRGLAILVGPDYWQTFVLRVDTQDEVFWGLPELRQLLWLMEEHHLAGVLLADHDGARFYRYWMRELVEEHTEAPKINVGEWRRKDLKPPSNPGVEMLRGTHRDAFERRMEARYARFYAAEIEHIRKWVERWDLEPVFLAGPPKLVEMVWDDLPKALKARTVLVREDLGHLPAGEFEARVESELQRWQQQYERSLVDRLFDSSGELRAVLGVDDMLVGLQEGLTRDAIVVRGIEEKVRQCTNCGWTDRTDGSVCAACGGARLLTGLRAVLPHLAKRYKIPLEVIADDAGDRLRKAGGIGALLK